MTYSREDLRQPAKIVRVFRGQEDHGIWTVSVRLEGKGWGQAFGMLCMKDETEARLFVQEVCAAFDTQDSETLAGRSCTALYSVSPRSTIEGLEAPSGKRFTIRGWRKRHYPNEAPTPTEEERSRLEGNVASLRRRLAEAEESLASLGTLIDWEEEA